jgi:hypothetical protein
MKIYARCGDNEICTLDESDQSDSLTCRITPDVGLREDWVGLRVVLNVLTETGNL